MSKTLLVEGDLATVDSRTILSTQGSVTAPSTLVPSWAKKISRIMVAAAADGLAVGSSVFFVRLGGNAVLRGEQSIMISASGTIAVQAGSDAAPQIGRMVIFEDVDIDVSPSDTVTISAEMAGSDNGTGRVVVGLQFE